MQELYGLDNPGSRSLWLGVIICNKRVNASLCSMMDGVGGAPGAAGSSKLFNQ